ncbi:MAG TPA: Na+/H+ antiporter subunit E [Firmicutes bacterium]|nr:Na+/H+ antiporter subunit E [Bacillota bacterium]
MAGRKDIRGAILIFALLMGFWLLLSATLHWQHLLVGTVLSLGITFTWSRIKIGGGRRTSFSLKQTGLMLYYLLCLIWEVLKANIMVALIVLNPRLPVSPGIVITRTALKRDLMRALYANSITLTPGTITVDLEDDRLVVHAITVPAGHGVLDWYLSDQAKKIEGEGS